MQEELEEIGFDEGEALDADDLATLAGPDGVVREYLVLAVVEVDGHDGAFAVLTSREAFDAGEEEELFIVGYDEEAEGEARFSVLRDESVIDDVRAALADLITFET